MSSEGKRLVRSQNDRMLAGVCGGLGQYFNVDPTLIRLLFVFFALFVGGGILTYIVLWVVMPQEKAGGDWSTGKVLSEDEPL